MTGILFNVLAQYAEARRSDAEKHLRKVFAITSDAQSYASACFAASSSLFIFASFFAVCAVSAA